MEQNRVSELFHRALELSAGDREEFVIRECGEDSEAAKQVLDLLATDDGASQLLGSPAIEFLGQLPAISLDSSNDCDLIGMSLDDKYIVREEIDKGSFGLVYRAEDQTLNRRRVVVKVLRRQPGNEDWQARQFKKEVESLSRLSHPGIVNILGCGELPDGRPYMVMQHVAGRTLREAINDGPMSLERTARLIEQIASALETIHRLGILHRDLKPENVMIQKTEDGQEYAILIDFGIAVVREAGSVGTAITEHVVGSRSYMPPEQFSGRHNKSSDIYALGLIAAEMLTGRGLHGSEPAPLGPPRVAAVIRRAIATSPGDRYQTAEEFRFAFEEACADKPAPPRRNSFMLPALGVVLLGVLGAAVWWRTPEKAPTDPVPARRNTISYALLLRSRGTAAYGEHAVPVSEDAEYASGDTVRLRVTTPEEGYLYLVNESPTKSGRPEFVFVYPARGPARIAARTEQLIPRAGITFDESRGIEKLWLVWSRMEVRQLEEARSFANERNEGRIGSEQGSALLAAYFKPYAELSRRVALTSTVTENTLTGPGDVLVHLLRLPHY